jgi:hypothetical protein
VIPFSQSMPVVAFFGNGIPVRHAGLLENNASFIKKRRGFHVGMILLEYLSMIENCMSFGKLIWAAILNGIGTEVKVQGVYKSPG